MTNDLAPRGTLWVCTHHGYMARSRVGGPGLAHPRWDDECYTNATLIIWPGNHPKGWQTPRGMTLDVAGGWEAPGALGEVNIDHPLLNSTAPESPTSSPLEDGPMDLDFPPPQVATLLDDHPVPMDDPPKRPKGKRKSRGHRVPKDPDYALWCRRLGILLVQAREAKGMNQAELTRAIGGWGSMVSDWERGCGAPSARNLARLFRVLGMDAALLLGIEDRFHPGR